MDKSANRKRGIKASRAKLERAMHAAGIKTQTALADKIADQESLPAPPKDMVNRAFRQKPVEPMSLERIAKALGVASHELYLSSDEQQPTQDSQTNTGEAPAIAQRPGWRHPLTTTAIALAIVLLALIFFQPAQSPVQSENGQPPSRLEPPLDRYSLLVNVETPELEPLAEELIASLSDELTMATLPEHETGSAMRAMDIARKYQADGVLTLRSQIQERYIRLETMIYIRGIERLMRYQVLTLTDYRQQLAGLAESLKNDISYFVSPAASAQAVEPENVQAWDNYLAARLLMDKHDVARDANDINAELYGALELDKDFAQGYAALCQALAMQSWVKEEKNTLEQASDACKKAQQLAPNNTYVRAVNAELDIYIGQPQKAVENFNQLLAQWPDNADALNGIGRAYHEVYNQQEEPDIAALSVGAEALKNAVITEPEYWFHHEALARLLFTKGDFDAAMASSKISAQMSGNLVSLTNVGVLSMCKGLYGQAEEMFAQVQESAPYSHMGHEYMGLLAFYLHDFDRAVQLNQVAKDIMGDEDDATIHQYWGYMGDAYRWQGNVPQALESYQQALKAVQVYRLRGTDGVWEQVAEIFYQLQIRGLSGNPSQLDAEQRIWLKELSEADVSLGVKVKVAQVLLVDEQVETAMTLWKSAGERCQVYQQHPDFKLYSETSATPSL